jgi:hypothetical protein
MNTELETRKHQQKVQELLLQMIHELTLRAQNHDKSKLESPEKEIFEVYTPKLKGTTYGSDEYNEFLKEMKSGLDHHYKNNRHHPEHHKNGIDGMDLIDLIELFCDWKSIEHNQDRFSIGDQLTKIFKNTMKYVEKPV